MGIRKASLYSHFESRQAIPDALVKVILEHYEAHSLFAGADGESGAGTQVLSPDAAAQMIQGSRR